MTAVSIIGRGGKTTIKTMLQGALHDVEIWEGASGGECEVIALAGLARPYRKELQYFSDASAVIANADANYSMKMPYECAIVDYGLSSKATVTASSIIQEERCQTFTCCVQRDIRTLSGKLILPREFPVRIDVPGKYNIYNALASISVLLIFDIGEWEISKVLTGLKFGGNMERIYDGGFSVIYNKISNPYQFFSVLESQSENEYKNIYIVLDDFAGLEPGVLKKIADILQEWLPVYNYTIYMENDGSRTSYLMKQLEMRKVEYRANKVYNTIKDIMHTAAKGDNVFLLGSERIKTVWSDYLNITKE